MIERVISEGRKVAMFCIISGVGCPAVVVGNSMVRDAMASRYVFLTTSKQASMAGIDTEVAKPLLRQLEEAGPGKAILGRASHKPEIVALPHATVDDIRSLVPNECPVSAQSVPITDNLSSGHLDGQHPELDLAVVSIVRKMTLDEKGVKEIASAAFPNIRDADAVKEVRRYLAYLMKENS